MGTKLVDKKSLTRYVVNAVEKKNENKASCKLSWNQPIRLRFHNFAMIRTWTYLHLTN